jgi:hypothetical protein
MTPAEPSPESSGGANFHLNWLAFAFAPPGKPIGKRLSQAVWFYAETRLKLPFADREGIVELRCTGEVAHRETIQPFERTGAPIIADQDLHPVGASIHSKASV